MRKSWSRTCPSKEVKIFTSLSHSSYPEVCVNRLFPTCAFWSMTPVLWIKEDLMLHSFCCHSQEPTSLHPVPILPKRLQHGPAASRGGWASLAELLPTRFARPCLHKWRLFFLSSVPFSGWVHSNRPRRACVCLPARMDRRWMGLLSHQQLPTAFRVWMPWKCHLHIHWAWSGKASLLLTFCTSSHLFCSAGTSCPHSSPGSPFPPGHMPILTQSSLPQLPFHFLLCVISPGANTVKYIRCVVSRSTGGISQSHSTEVTGAMQEHGQSYLPTSRICTQF